MAVTEIGLEFVVVGSLVGWCVYRAMERIQDRADARYRRAIVRITYKYKARSRASGGSAHPRAGSRTAVRGSSGETRPPALPVSPPTLTPLVDAVDHPRAASTRGPGVPSPIAPAGSGLIAAHPQGLLPAPVGPQSSVGGGTNTPAVSPPTGPVLGY
jgi:hypothetical protein